MYVCVLCVCALFCKEFLFLLGLGKLTKLVFTKKKGKKERKKPKIVKRKIERKKEEDNLTLELVGGGPISLLIKPPQGLINLSWVDE